MDLTRRDLFKIGGKMLVLVSVGATVEQITGAAPPSEAYKAAEHWWGMIIDIDKCIGCGNCVRACSKENNVPDGYFRIDAGEGTTFDHVGGDEHLFLDGQSRRQPFVTIGIAKTADASLRLLIQNAYTLQPFQIVGGPDSVVSGRYQIEAKAEGNASRSQVFLMLQSLLEDRFQLKIHRESRELPVYALVAAKNGLRLPRPKDGGCVDPVPDAPTDWAARPGKAGVV